jgi:hypothetical protein
MLDSRDSNNKIEGYGMQIFRLFVIAAAIFLTGCAATGPRYSEVEASFPTLRPGYGRLVVYRSGGLGQAVQPDIKLNGEVVGKSQPQGFFFVDRTAGRYTVSARTEIETTLEAELEDGRTTYVQTSITVGLLVGQPRFTLRSESTAIQHLPHLAYIGGIPLVPGKPRAVAVNNTAGRGTDERTRASGPVTLDDLNGLLPSAPPAGAVNNPAGRSTANERSRASGPATLDDLSGLLPPAR